MTLNTSNRDIITHRRERVASLRLRGMTQRGLVLKLAEEGIVNAKDGQPYSVGTVNSDLQMLDKQWREQASASMHTLKARVLAEIRELRREAWIADALFLVLKGLQQEIELLGLKGSKQQIAPQSENTSALSGIKGSDHLNELIGVALTRATESQRTELVEKYESLLACVKSLGFEP